VAGVLDVDDAAAGEGTQMFSSGSAPVTAAKTDLGDGTQMFSSGS
jgi:hypothetical protein